MQPASAPWTPMNTTQGRRPATDANPLELSPYHVERVTAVLVVRDTRNAPSLHTLPAHPLQPASAANLSAALGPSAALAHRTADGRQPTAHRRSNVLPTPPLTAPLLCCGASILGEGHLDPDRTPK